MDEPTISYRAIEELNPDERNMRVHPQRNLDVIKRSIQEDGWARSIVVDEDDNILAGNGAWESAVDAGITKVLVVETEGDVVIAHKRRNLDPAGKLRVRFRDNLASDLSIFDDVLVGQEIFAHPDLFTDLTQAEQDVYLLAAGRDAGKQQLKPDAGPKINQAVELQARWGTAEGQVWQISSLSNPGSAHRLVIGDSRDPRTLQQLFAGAGARAKLVCMDPPYGVDYAAKNAYLNKADKGNRNQTPITGDSSSPQATQDLIHQILLNLDAVSVPGAVIYLHGPSGDLMSSFLDSFTDSPFKMHQGLVWVKDQFVIGMNDYHFKHEMIYYGWKRDAAHFWCGDRTQDSVLYFPKPDSSGLHPTMKPVELLALLINNSSLPGEIICDPTVGSGSTAVAAEQEGRLCFMVEQEPTNAAVVLERLTDLGLTASLVHPESESNHAREVQRPDGDDPKPAQPA